MSKTSRFVLASLALGLLLALPGFATEAESDLDQICTEEAILGAPAEMPEEPGLADPGADLRVNTIRDCDPDEQAQCPPGCSCVFASNQVWCNC